MGWMILGLLCSMKPRLRLMRRGIQCGRRCGGWIEHSDSPQRECDLAHSICDILLLHCVCAGAVCGRCFQWGTEPVCETLDGLTARPVQVRLLPHGVQRADNLGNSGLDLAQRES